MWPFLGPSTVRDTVGLVGDTALNPLSWISYFFLTPLEGFGNYSYDAVNDFSIDKGQTYESITEPAIDPYIALQDSYIQNRVKKTKE
ncbi:MAG: VacJ family lipoprotein [Planctomycetes bacterium]|nr:VacJ family lipoprotein [Planctomycetota bacterium]